MVLWLVIQLLVITSFIAGYLLGSKENGVVDRVKQLKEYLPQPKYKILKKKQPQTQDEKTLEELEKNFNAENKDKE